MAKFVQPIFDVYGVADFKNQVTFDASVYLTGATYISDPSASTEDNPYALIVESVGSSVIVKQRQLGDMAWASSAIYDASIAANNQKWIDSNRNGFLNQIDTSISFEPTTGVFTLADAGSGWSYYLAGEKYDITGDVTVALPGGGSAADDRYYIYINNVTTGALTVDTDVWDRETGQLPVAFIDFEDGNTFTEYWLGEERHTMLIDTRMHKYLHETQGTQFIAGGTLDGPVVGVAPYTGTTDASNAIGVAATTIADEDIFLTLAELTKPTTPSEDYNVFYRTGASSWSWKFVDTPLPEDGSYIQYDNGAGLTEATDGKFVNTYLLFTNINGLARYTILPGQGVFDTFSAAIDENPADFDLTGLPMAEYVIAWQFTWETAAGLTTAGKVALAGDPVRIQVNSATATTPTTESHNDLIGIQGGAAGEYYHLDSADYADRVGKSYVDGSIATLVNEDTRQDASIVALFGENDTQDLHLSALDASVGLLVDEDTRQDASIVALFGENDTQDLHLAAVDASIVRIDASLNDVVEATDLFYEKDYIDGSFGLRDASIEALFAIAESSTGSGTYATTLSDTLAMPEDVGGILSGTQVSDLKGDTFIALFDDLLFPTVQASSTNPTYSISGISGTTQEIGTSITPTVNGTYVPGTITNGDGTSGPALKGDAATYSFKIPSGAVDASSPVSATGNTITGYEFATPYTLVDGTNTWESTVTYLVGTGAYYDNKGGVGSNLNRDAGSLVDVNISASIPARYIGWSDTGNKDSYATTSAAIRSAGYDQWFVTGSFSINIPATNQAVWFYLPPGFTVTQIQDPLTFATYQDDFVQYDVSINIGGGSGAETGYKLWYYDIGTVGWPETATFNVTLA